MTKRGKLSDLEKKVLLEKHNDGFSVEELAEYTDRSRKQVADFLSVKEGDYEELPQINESEDRHRSTMQKQMNPRSPGEQSRGVTVMDEGAAAMSDRKRQPKKPIMERFDGVMHKINAKPLNE